LKGILLQKVKGQALKTDPIQRSTHLNVKEWIQAWAGYFGHKKPLQEELIRLAWERCVGPLMASQTMALKWDGGDVVYVRLASSAASQELRLKEQEWLKAMATELKEIQIKEIRTF
jgi:hypothetical protein